jgi:guanylate kinase
MLAGKLIIITGPSGVGKGTIVRSLRQRHRELELSISATTRSPRRGEIDGRDYHFCSRSEFEEAIADGEFLEWAEYAGNYYGTPKTKIKEQLEQGHSILLEIETVGARAIAKLFPDSRRIFILPPSLEELERRISQRGKNSAVDTQRRLEIAKAEIAVSQEFDFCIVNDDLENAIEAVEKAIFA